jgi:nicotinamide-nucleotide amidase
LTLRAEILSIGDELTSGQRLDTNSQWLSIQLADLGVSTAFHTTVGDTLADNIEVFRRAADRADIVISTGGLGPTADDLTREAMAEAFHRPLEFRDEAMKHIESLFTQRRRPMPERNRIQAMFPQGSLIIPNPHGTAPGIDLTISSKKSRIFALPGVPAEMTQMWEETVVPRLREDLDVGKQRWFYRVLKVFGIGESDVEAKLPDLIQRDRIPRVGITVSKATISLRIACLAEHEQSAADASQSTEAEIRQALGDLIFGEGGDELDDVVYRMLKDKSESVSLIEIGGDSILASWLARHGTPADANARVGLVDAIWKSCLSTDEESESGMIEAFRNLVDAQRVKSDTDWCLAIGPYPTYESIHSQTGMPTCKFVIAISGRHCTTQSERFELGGHPELIHQRIAKSALDYFRRHAKHGESNPKDSSLARS